MKDPFCQCDISSDQENIAEILVPKHFQNLKFFKELNFMQNEKLFRQKKIRERRISNSIRYLIQANLNKSKKPPQSEFGNKQISFNGHIIRNSFKKRKLDGSTQILYQTGVNFKGILKDGKFKSGTFDFKNGYIYVGQLYGKRFYGKGTLTCPDGKKITGIWNGDIIDGKAQIVYPNGDIYYGLTKKFKKDGQGYLFFSNGAKYTGQFKEGKITGYGSYFNKQNVQFRGVWENGKLVNRCSVSQFSLISQRLKQNTYCNVEQDQIDQINIKLSFLGSKCGSNISLFQQSD